MIEEESLVLPKEVKVFFRERRCPLCKSALDLNTMTVHDYDDWYHTNAYCGDSSMHYRLAVGWMDPKMDIRIEEEWFCILDKPSYLDHAVTIDYLNYGNIHTRIASTELDHEFSQIQDRELNFDEKIFDLDNCDEASLLVRLKTALLWQ